MNNDAIRAGTRVYVTKYAIAGNGQSTEETVRRVDGAFIYLEERASFYSIQLGKDAFTTKAEADAAILKAFDRKIAQVKKQLDRLTKIRNEVAGRIA